MYIERLRLENWLRYAGTSVVDLRPSIYGITARFDGDERRSNWGGKTAFVEAIRFALYGTHRGAREDDWITHGANGGSVELHLSDGSIVRRSRRRGHSTQLQLERAGALATGPAAQEAIVAMVGLSSDDFEVTCWFGQKQLARLVLAKPTERFDLVSGWFGLEPLQRCEERTRAELAALLQEREQTARRREGVAMGLATRAMQWVGVSGEGTRSASEIETSLRSLLDEKDHEFVERGTTVQSLNDALANLEIAKQAQDAKDELDRVRWRGKEVSAQLEALQARASVWEAAIAAHDAARLALHDAAQGLRCAKQLKAQAFDGRCPVDHATCPVAHEINGRVDINAKRYDDALITYDHASKRESLARYDREEADTERTQMGVLSVEREQLRERARHLLKQTAHVPAFDQGAYARLSEHAQQARVSQARTGMEIEALLAALSDVRLMGDEIAEADAAIATLHQKEKVARAALRIFGRQGAQKQIAEGALSEIEAEANAILLQAAIDLRITIRWSHGGSGLAAWCDQCGSPYPTSTKVRKCALCSAERGPKMIERLDVALSDRSGAAEDLAGAALQLAAAAWLRRERTVSWSVGLLDEPFGSLDEANRKAFAAQLTAMLRGSAGFEQAFIIAHHPDVTDSLPDAILVGARRDASVLQATGAS